MLLTARLTFEAGTMTNISASFDHLKRREHGEEAPEHLRYWRTSSPALNSAQQLLAAPLGYVPQIDMETRQILSALLQDLHDHRQTCRSPQECENAGQTLRFIVEVLEDILGRSVKTHGTPHSLPKLI